MNKSTNYKIQKYSYKLEHAKNKTEANLYKAKLASYTSKQKGGVERTAEEKAALKKKYDELIFSAQIENNDLPMTEDNLRVMLDYNFLDTEEEIKKLEPLLKQRLADFLKECCPKGECPPPIAPQVEKIKQLWIELIDKVSKSKQSDVNELVRTESDKIMALFKCEKQQQAVPVVQGATLSEEDMANEERRRKELLKAAASSGQAVGQLVQGETIPSATGELGEDIAQAELKGGKRKRRTKKN